MTDSTRLRVTELLAQVAALDDVRDLVLVAKTATERLALAHSRVMRAGIDDVGRRVELLDLNKELDGLAGTIAASKRPPRRGYTHMMIVELDGPSAATLARRSEKWRNAMEAGIREIPVSRSNLSLLRE